MRQSIVFLCLLVVLCFVPQINPTGFLFAQEGTLTEGEPAFTPAATITVNSLADTLANDDQCTLREAIIAANTNVAGGGCTAGAVAGMDALDLTTLSGSIALLTPLPTITTDISLTASSGALTLTRAANAPSFRLLSVSGGMLSLTDITLSGGRDASGAGIAAIDATLTLTRVTLTDNDATSSGGAIYARNTALTVTETTADHNAAGSSGGAFFVSGGLMLTRSTISNNSAGSSGGGIYLSGGESSIVNSTLSGNTAVSAGGGLYSDLSASFSLNNATIADNSAAQGGGVVSNGSMFANTILAGNVGGDCAGMLVSLDYNLIQAPTCEIVLDTTNNITGINPLLAALADNGGATFTHMLTLGSPALDAARSSGTPACATPDQRGVARPIGAACDIGAVEAPPPPPPVVAPINGTVLRGFVMNRDGLPLSGVTISVLDKPEYGTTQTFLDGTFSLAVQQANGTLTINYDQAGYLPSQRYITVRPNDYVWAEDVALIPLDPAVTTVDVSAPTMQVARGSSVTDDDGTRRATLIIPAGTSASIVSKDGALLPAYTELNIRATEYTVGDTGVEAMPGELPPTSGYTYAVEYSADEVPEGGTLTFSQPVFHYVENFENIPVGMIVPMGYYDREQAAWIASENGRVIKIISITSGRADIDSDGDGAVDTLLGLSDAERQQLAALYAVGQELWRVPITHFTPWDCNFPYGPPENAQAPQQSEPQPGDQPEDDPCLRGGSVIGCENQTLGESVGITGTGFTLNYSSERVVGRSSAYTLEIPLTGATLPPNLKQIDVEIQIAGRRIIQTYPAAANQRINFVWDRADAYGRLLDGAHPVSGRVGYVYDAVYYAPSTFGQAFAAFGTTPITGSRARQEVTLWQNFSQELGVYDARQAGLAGWTVDVHHYYDADAGTLHMGDGMRRSAEAIAGSVITTVAGGSTVGDNGQAVSALLINPNGVDSAPDGSIYIADFDGHRIRRVSPSGIITTVAGTGTAGFSGDGGPARNSRINRPLDVAVAADGSVYFTDSQNHRIRRIGTNGIITTIAGTGITGFTGDGGQATAARLNIPNGITIANDGSVYFADFSNHRVRRVAPNGVITTVAGTGISGFSGNGGLATGAQIFFPTGIEVLADGSFYIVDRGNHRVRYVNAAGVISTFAGTGVEGFSGDGGQAASAQLRNPYSISRASDGSLYVGDSSNFRIRRIAPNGIISTIAGTGVSGSTGDGGSALTAQLNGLGYMAFRADGTLVFATGVIVRTINTSGIINRFAGGGVPPFDGNLATAARLDDPEGIAVGADGSLYIADHASHRIRRVEPNGVISTFAGTGTSGFSGDGGQATAAQLNNPEEIVIDIDGSMYIADQSNHRVRRIAPDGIITTIAGIGTSGFSGDGGLATAAQLNFPEGLTIAPDGSLYIADSSNHRIRRIAPDGIITTIAGTGTAGYSGDGGQATLARLNEPEGLAFGSDGSLYVAEASNHRVRRITPDGIITTFAGTGTAGSIGDGGLATLARLNSPDALAMGTDGVLYIAEQDGHRIRRIGTDGIIATVTGTGFTGFTGDNGSAASAQLNFPLGITISADGSLYVGDTENQRVRRVSPTMPSLTVGDIAIPSEDGGLVYVFNNTGRHLRTVNALTGATMLTFGYDSAGRLMTITDGDNNVTTIQRNAAGQPTAILSPDNQLTTLEVNPDGYLTRIADPLNQAHTMTYAIGGLLTSFADARGNTTQFAYDAGGRLVQHRNAANGITTLMRGTDADGYVVTMATPLNRTTVYDVSRNTLDTRTRANTLPNGLQTQSTRTTGAVRSTTASNGMIYSSGQTGDPRFGMLAPLTSSTTTTPANRTMNMVETRTAVLSNPSDPLSLTTLTENVNINGRIYGSLYNAATRTFTLTTPVGRGSTVVIDTQGRVTSQQVNGLTATSYAYDGRGRLTMVSQGGRTLTMAYNAAGYVSLITDPLNRVIAFTYDAVGRVLTETLPGNRTIAYGYDAAGNLTSLTPPGRPAHTFAYNALNQVTSYAPPNVNPGADATTYSYNADRQPTGVSLPDGRNVTMTYDSAGRISGITIARGSFSYSYSPTTGNLTNINAPGSIGLAYTYDGSLLTGEILSGTVAGSVTRSYNNNFWVTGVAVNGANIAYSYDNDGLITAAGALTLSYNPQNGLLTGTSITGGSQSVVEALTYSGFGELATYAAARGGTGLYNVTYTRDNLGRISQLVETIGGVNTTYGYVYDSAGRLSSVTRNGAAFEAYTYDANGNRLTAAVNGVNATGTYDNQDRLLTYGGATYAYNANGDLVSKTQGGQTTSYSYDELGNLTQVVLPSGTTIQYLIDGAGRRVGVRQNGTLQRGYLWQSDLRIAAELNASNQVVSRFVYATGANVPDYMIKNGVTYRILTDHLGSVRLVVNTTDGTIAQRIDYDAWGNMLQDTNPGFQPFGYAGGLYDPQTGLVRFGARDYDAKVGRWTTKDPIGFAGGDTNLYAYVGNNPVNGIDTQGKILPILLIVASGAFTGALSGGGTDLAIQLINNGGNIDCVDWGQVGTNAAIGGAFGAIGTPGLLSGVARITPYWRYIGPEASAAGRWLTRGAKPPYGRNFTQAADSLQLPNMPNNVVRAPVKWYEPIAGPRSVSGNPQWGSGGGVEYYRGWSFPRNTPQ
jgi:RHS repeat-associated protein/CSLREA domain-containing protein